MEDQLLSLAIQEETEQLPNFSQDIDFLFEQARIASDRETQPKIKIQKFINDKYSGTKQAIIDYEQRDCGNGALELAPHQQFLSKYFPEHSERGILLYHGTGTGKTITSIAMANSFIKDNNNNTDEMEKVIVFLPASLKDNFKSNIQKYNKIQVLQRGEIFDTPIEYISSNGMKDTLDNLNDNTIVILDECQVFSSMVANGSMKSAKIYRQLLESKCKIIALSATPVINSVFELWLMLVLCMSERKKKKLGIHRNGVFTKDGFYDMFYRDAKVQNHVKFYSYISQTMSYYNPPKNDSKLYPRQNIHMEHLEMSKYQSDIYNYTFENEPECLIDCRKLGKKRTKKLAKYFVQSRQATTSVTKDSDSDSDSDTDTEISNLSIKFDSVLKRIAESSGPIIVFSFFIEKVLGKLKETINQMFPEYNVEMYTGTVSTSERDSIIKKFNQKKNVNGSIIKVILISGAGAEGISLRNTRQVHILEPHWNETRIHQAIGRAVRLCSHTDLPRDQQIVDVYRYFSKTNLGKDTIDHTVYNVAKKKQDYDNEIMDFIHSASIDCMLYGREECFE